MDQNLVQKYNIAGPRYTSYPTVPFWDEEGIDYQIWINSVKRSFQESNSTEGISLYIHLPFCENLCTFCGCHKRITKQHTVEEPYVETVLKEWDLYCDLFDEKPRIKELHLGGGTPTFFSADHLNKLITGILERAEKCKDYEFSFEAHPNNTTENHLQTLFDLGFKRNSFGVQDYDLKVQKTINRIQPFEKVKEVTEASRRIGYNSISHDLVFGLPHQTKESMIETINLTKELKPDRIAFYSYAHVPWIKGVGQRGYDENDLPSPDEKRVLYESGKQLLGELGYVEIGMDHFALKTDSMYKAMENKSLHRNFMGYTAGKTQLMIGLGMSSISDSWYSFAQNDKTVEEYQTIVNEGRIPIFRGHDLSQEDLVIRQHILNIMCHFETSWTDSDMKFPELEECISRLKEMELDGLVIIEKDRLYLPESARPFVRNVCMAFDLRLIRNQPKTRIFSMTI
ncbi:MAG: oxygen-independent coproporphyrinogen III oxidase [Flavobacteriales bacterium]|nr:oxygen-independent coproporphyrinogen III oxidase [Flavobacteriales bacterium]MCB9197626.1 oxygen-independent coproporphyrinogen III oxidase [Flavobacteriales bacterium]